MAVITNSTDATFTTRSMWKIPPGLAVENSVIPRGMLNFNGSVAVAALGAGDVLRLRVRFVFPLNHVYRLKDFSVNFASDDATVSLEKEGTIAFNTADLTALANIQAVLTYDYGIQAAQYVYDLPDRFSSPLLFGANADRMVVAFTDLTPTSVAGDLAWSMSFYQFDVEQASHFPIHTDIPVHR